MPRRSDRGAREPARPACARTLLVLRHPGGRVLVRGAPSGPSFVPAGRRSLTLTAERAQRSARFARVRGQSRDANPNPSSGSKHPSPRRPIPSAPNPHNLAKMCCVEGTGSACPNDIAAGTYLLSRCRRRLQRICCEAGRSRHDGLRWRSNLAGWRNARSGLLGKLGSRDTNRVEFRERSAPECLGRTTLMAVERLAV